MELFEIQRKKKLKSKHQMKQWKVQVEQKPDKIVKRKADGLKKKKKKKKKKQMEEEEEKVNEVISEVRNPSDKDIDSEEDDFWMPPSGERWDFDDGGDRWGSGSESGPETDDASGTNVGDEENNNDANELSKKEKRKSIEMEPSALATRKKMKKNKSTSQD